ncbi:hypothetical protein D3C87_1457190 [compost metagenome]
MTCVRISSFGAFKLTAKRTFASAIRHISGTIPDVETVIFLRDKLIPHGEWITSIVLKTGSGLSSGSPMPMNTMFVMRWPGSRRSCTCMNCPTMSSVRNLRFSFCLPVKQNLQPMLQPTSDEIHKVRRPSDGITTDSTLKLSPTSNRNFCVPSTDFK